MIEHKYYVVIYTWNSFPVDAVDYCAANPSEIVATPDNCAQYYNCTERQTTIGDHMMECKYPDLFSRKNHTCQNFETVQCTTRREPQAPCKSFLLASYLSHKIVFNQFL